MKYKCNWVIKGSCIIEAEKEEDVESMLMEEITVPSDAELTDWWFKPARG